MLQVALMMIRGKAMSDKAGDLMSLMHDIVLTAKLDDKERFTQMVLETKAGMEAGVVGSGHSFAASRLAAQRSTSGTPPLPRMSLLSCILDIFTASDVMFPSLPTCNKEAPHKSDALSSQ